MKKPLRTAVCLAALTLMNHSPAQAQPGGTDILHLTLTASLSGDAGSGSVFADHKQQGRAEKQTLAIQVAGLLPNTTYQVLVTTTTRPDPVAVAELTTDSAGMAAVRYSKKGQGKGGKKGAIRLPAALDPVSALRTLEISSNGAQTVLRADLTAPDKLQYLVKYALANEGTDEDASGSLRIKSNGRQEEFRLWASGLDAAASYHLLLNEAVAGSYVSDASGQLQIDELPAGAPSVLKLVGVALADGATNRVLSTPLP